MAPTRQPDAEYLALIDQLRDAMDSRPDDLTGHRLLAQHEAGLGNFRAAYEAQERVIEIRGTDATAENSLRWPNFWSGGRRRNLLPGRGGDHRGAAPRSRQRTCALPVRRPDDATGPL
jgi:hypothetical protein